MLEFSFIIVLNWSRAYFVLSSKQSDIDFWRLADKSQILFLFNVVFKTIWLKAVLRPENEKFGFLDLYIGLGNLKILGSPDNAIFSIIGPPGNPIPRILAALSKVSPAASSKVELNL